jgi:hypothetical protein
MKTALGNRLSATDQAYVRSAYVHRFTKEHRPAWLGRGDCVGCPPHFASDADWLAHTTFKVNANGALNRRSKTCESCPTWPDNPELRHPSSVQP